MSATIKKSVFFATMLSIPVGAAVLLLHLFDRFAAYHFDDLRDQFESTRVEGPVCPDFMRIVEDPRLRAGTETDDDAREVSESSV